MVYQKISKSAPSNSKSPEKSILIAPRSVSSSPTSTEHFHNFTQIPAYSPVIQAKLTIGAPNDRYEQEADRVAAQVVQQLHHPASIQRQGELDETIQSKSMLQRPDAIVTGDASADLSSAIDRQRGGGQALDIGLQQSMGQAMGADFSRVRVHTDGGSDRLNRSLQSKAFTTGHDVFFQQGEYNPGSRGGQELIAHELTHVVQQNGSAVQRFASTTIPTIQRYTEEEIGGDNTRVADDRTAAVTQEASEGGQEMFADEGIVAVGRQKLKVVKSGIELQTGSRTMNIIRPDASVKILKQIWPKNKQNKTGGIKKPSLKDKIRAKVSGKPAPEPQMEMMKLWADCGMSNGVVIGGSNRRAVFESQADDTVEKTSAGGPSKMKAQVLMKVLSEVADKWDSILKTMDKSDSDRTTYEDCIKEVRDEESWTKNEWLTVSNMIKTASTDDDWEKVRDKYDEIADHVLTLYTSFSQEDQDRWSRFAGINEYATPDIGQGFTISSGGENLSSNTWNFHWAGVILKSADGADSVTLENYAVGDPSVQNDEWVFQMYGHKQKEQTFHQQHKGSGLHGKTPTTMVVENVSIKK